ncbi:hypothetical protein E2986_13279 [Frieseomelitta varia]|uniref:ADAMTS cysteine-rich domain-containing protein n=1 Tax=Frieseomelitta varia TaxID=561572 RepID=A0A833RX27_9HYME|nr:hypothetical protein E2986_13279 [Frieseomelitta varia]
MFFQIIVATFNCSLNLKPFKLQYFHSSGDTATCLYNAPHEDEALPRVLPGKLLSLDAQCRKDRGTSACFKDDRVCAQLFCFDAGSGYCVAYRPAAEGSACGDGQYCLNGKCVAEHENIIPDYTQNIPTYVRRDGNFNPTALNRPLYAQYNNTEYSKNGYAAGTTTRRYTNYSYYTVSPMSKINDLNYPKISPFRHKSTVSTGFAASGKRDQNGLQGDAREPEGDECVDEGSDCAELIDRLRTWLIVSQELCTDNRREDTLNENVQSVISVM